MEPTAKRARLTRLVGQGLVVVALLGGLAVTPTRAATFDLTDQCPGGVGDLAALRQAITSANAASDADTIVLASGCIYTVAAPDSGLNGLPTISAPLEIIGAGTTIERLNAPEVPNFRIVEVGAGVRVMLADLTLRNGAAPSGGGILNAGQLTLRNVTVADSEADDGDPATIDGGAIYNAGQLELWDASALTNNTAGSGGALANAGSALLDAATVSGNGATDYSGAGGGGIASQSGSLTLRYSSVLNNSSEAGGAGIANQAGSQVLLEQSTVGSNTTPYGGGGGILNAGQLTLSSSTVSRNTTRFSGGGVANQGSALVLNSTISGNAARFEGGGIANSGTLTLTLSTLAENSGAGTLYTSESASSRLSNSLLAGSFVCYGAVSSLGYNLDTDGSCGLAATGDISGGLDDLQPLAANGGPTATHLLGPGSAARDAGDCAAGTVDYDQRGVARPSGPACDIGAVELVRVDTVPPETLIVEKPPLTSASTSATFVLSGTDDLTPPGQLAFACALDGAPLTPCSSPQTYINLAEGRHTFLAQAIDTSGNADPSPASWTWTVDTRAPKLACTVSPKQLWPPNHSMRTVKARVILHDSGGASFRLVSVTSNEPGGAEDIRGFAVGTPDTEGLLRAERDPHGTGRIYRLTYEARDQSGNTASCQVHVTVPRRG